MTQQTLLSLISDSLWKGTYSSELSPEILAEAKLQAVSGLIQDASYQQIAAYVRYTYEEGELVKLLEGKNIPLVILKGSAAAVYYPIPSARSFGDIDFIVEPESFSDAARLLEANGYIRAEDEGRHIAYSRNGTHFELHRRFSYDYLDFEKYVLNGIENRVRGKVDEHEFPMLPPLANGLVLLAHMSSHLRSGMGLRQLIDWMMYVDKVLDDSFWRDSFQPAADELGLTTLAITATVLCQKYLGLKDTLTWARDADEEIVDRLLDSLLISGNFGRKQGKGNAIERITAAIKKEGLLSYLQRAGEYNWKAYHKHPWLRPFCWIFQIIHYMKHGKGRIGKIREDVERGNDRYELLRKLGT